MLVESEKEKNDLSSEVPNITELDVALEKAISHSENLLNDVRTNNPIENDSIWVDMRQRNEEIEEQGVIEPLGTETYEPVNLGIDIEREDDDDEWSATDETLGIIMQSAIRYHLAYKKEYMRSNGIRAHYGVYIILGSGINSIFIAGGNNFISPYIITILTCMLSLITGLIQSFKTFFKVDERVDSCLIASKDLFKLYCDIHFMLGQPPQFRKVDADKYITDITARYIQILDVAVSLSNGKDNPIFDRVLREKLRSNLEPVSP